jgi:hypothetical protein
LNVRRFRSLPPLVQILEHGRHDELVTVGTETVEQPAAQLFDLAGFRRQDVGDILGK